MATTKEERHPLLGKKVKFQAKNSDITITGTVDHVDVNGAVTIIRGNGTRMVAPIRMISVDE